TIDTVSVELTTSNISLLIYGVFAEAKQQPFSLISDAAEVPVWQNPSTPGMAYLSRSPVEYEQAEEIVEQMNSWPEGQGLPVFFDLADGPAPERAPSSQRLPGESSVTYKRTQSDKITIEVQSDFDAVLAVAEGYSPHWTATQDGEPIPIYRANHCFMATQVNAGGHTIEFQYFPKPYYYGCSLGATALLLIFALLFLYPRLWLIRDKNA
ncbi:YfhO family protein, partial [bacterium]|nr:YfhO family protein [bacterium]